MRWHSLETRATTAGNIVAEEMEETEASLFPVLPLSLSLILSPLSLILSLSPLSLPLSLFPMLPLSLSLCQNMSH